MGVNVTTYEGTLRNPDPIFVLECNLTDGERLPLRKIPRTGMDSIDSGSLYSDSDTLLPFPSLGFKPFNDTSIVHLLCDSELTSHDEGSGAFGQAGWGG